mgnify:FL=1
MMLAENFNDFIDKVSEAERTALNSPAGQELTQKLLEMKLAQNPNMTPEEWAQTKSEFMTFMFAMPFNPSPSPVLWHEKSTVSSAFLLFFQSYQFI